MTNALKNRAAEQLELESAAMPKGLLRQHPIEDYLAHFDKLTGIDRYDHVPDACSAICRSICQAVGEDGLGRYHRIVLLTLLERDDPPAKWPAYPESILSCREKYLAGLIAQAQRNPAAFYHHSNDRFSKDLAVCRHRLVPCGAQLIDVRSGVPRSLLYRQTACGALDLLGYMLASLGGFKVLYELHMDPRLVLEFNANGWMRCYARIADLLEIQPEIRGVFGTSWWFDPALATISRRLGFLREIPLSGGARLFRSCSTQASLDNATANSRERQAAVDEGAYRPTDWSMVWSRKALIAWAKGSTR